MRHRTLVQLGYGSVGKEFVRHLHAQHDRLLKHADIDLRLVAIATSTQFRYAPDGINDGGGVWDGAYTDWDDLKASIQYDPSMIVIDMSAAATTEIHRDVLTRGGVVVTANKKPLTDRYDAYRLLHTDLIRYFYETTVGSSTPVIQTLQDIVATGDEVIEIQALVSGTLGFVCSELRKEGARFSDIVRRAKEQGYTEPHPRDDLSGMDVARKALILGREIGLTLELSDVALQGLLPKDIAVIDDVPMFLKALETLDTTYASRVYAWRQEGRVPQFVARINHNGIRVGLEGVLINSPLGQLEGPENLVTFTTNIFKDKPLVLRGQGAGASYTAAGVLSDVIRAVRTRL